MFNTKRIIFLIGLLSIVALTGALMAGPAFANPGHGKGNGGPGTTETAKVYICHYAEMVPATFDELSGAELTAQEDSYSKVINVDFDSQDGHLNNVDEPHTDGNDSDTLIDDVFTSAMCDARNT